MAHNLIYATMDTVGDGSGVTNANVNGSVTPVLFRTACPPNQRYFINRMFVQIVDAGPFDADGYGGLSGLTNGLEFGIYSTADEQLVDMLGGWPIQANSDWARTCFDIAVQDFGTGTDDAISVRWTFSKDLDRPLILEPGEYLGMTINDDLTGLATHCFLLRGTFRNV